MSENDSPGLNQNSVTFAWKVHDQQEAWLEKADFKASLLLPFQVGILALLGAVLLSDRRPKLDLAVGVLVSLGVAVICLGIFLAALAVTPQLDGQAGNKSDLIYFGHLRELGVTTIESRINELDSSDELSALSRQLQILSTLNWKKHRLIRWGIFATFLGAALSSIPLMISWLFL